MEATAKESAPNSGQSPFQEDAWLILIGGCPLSAGIQTTFGRDTPLIVGRVY